MYVCGAATVQPLKTKVMAKQTFIIKDWADNRMFPDKSFSSFEKGWEYVQKNVDNSEYERTGNENDNVHLDIFVVESGR